MNYIFIYKLYNIVRECVRLKNVLVKRSHKSFIARPCSEARYYSILVSYNAQLTILKVSRNISSALTLCTSTTIQIQVVINWESSRTNLEWVRLLLKATNSF